jgi:prophage maintenance system killer protein
MENRITKINTKIAGGKLINPSNLRYDLEQAQYAKTLFRQQAHVVRGIVVGHSFHDGNKRTAAQIMMKDFGKAGYKCDEETLSKGLQRISASQTNNIQSIEGKLRKWFIKK